MSKKRANNEGSIFQRANGDWYAQLSYLGLDGKRKFRTKKAKSQRHARLLLTEMKEKQVNFSPALSSLTLREFIKSWLAAHVQTTKASATYENYKGVANKWVVPSLGKLLVCDLNALHVTEWIQKMEEAQTGRPTMRRAFVTLSAAMDYAISLTLIRTNPCNAIERPKVEDKEVYPLTEEEVMKIYATKTNDRLYALYVLAFTTGM